MKDSIKKCGNCFHFEFVYRDACRLIGTEFVSIKSIDKDF